MNKYKLSYTQWYTVDHLSMDSEDYHQYFNTIEEALEEYKKLKAKNVLKEIICLNVMNAVGIQAIQKNA